MTSATVQDLCRVVTSGGTPKRSVSGYFSPATVPWVKTGDLSDGPVTSVKEFISERGLAESAAKLLPAGTVLMAMYGATVGAMGWLSQPMSCNQAACAMVADPSVCDWRWLFYALLAKRNDIIGLANGAAQQNLNVGIIARTQLDPPSLSTQRAIAEVLGALDDKIAANQGVVASSAELMAAQARMVEQAGQLTALGELAASHKESVSPSGMGRVAHFSLPAFDVGATASPDHGEQILSAKLRIRKPCVLLSRLNPRIPRVWDIPTLPEFDAVASTEFLVLEPRGVSTGALWSALSQPSVLGRLQELAKGTSGSHQRVSPADAMAVSIPDMRRASGPALELLESLSRLRQGAIDQSRRLAALRDTLLPHLMSGRLSVRQAEAQVEAVL